MSAGRKNLIGVCRKLIGLSVITAAALAAGCSGSSGSPGKNGVNGDAGVNGTSCSVTDNHDGTSTIHCTDGTSATVSNGANGDAGINGTSCTLINNDAGTRTINCGDAGGFTVLQGVVDYVTMTPDERMQAAMSAVITSVSVPADGRPVVNIKVSERHGYGVKNLSSVAGVTWRFSLLKLAAGVNGSANDTWVSYLAANDHTVASAETAAAANLTDNGDGTYAYRLAQVINGGATAAGTTYEADKAHRLIVLLYASGNPFTPINLVKEFIPMTGADVTGQNDKVDQNACLECHTTFRAISGGTGELGSGEFHGGVRYDVRTCVACHNDQRRFSSTGTPVTEPAIAADGTWTGNAGVINNEAVLDLPVFIHKIHMGNKLTLTGGTYAGVPKPYETTYPQDVRNCAKCHRSPAPKADNWKTSVSRRACGACHDDKSFDATIPNARVMHSGGMQADDSHCTVCHAAGSVAGDVPSKHLSVSPPNPHNIYLDQSDGGQLQHQRGLRRRRGIGSAGREGDHLRSAKRRAECQPQPASGVPVHDRRPDSDATNGRDAGRASHGRPRDHRAHPRLRRRAERVLRLRSCPRTASARPPTSTPRRAATSATSGTATATGAGGGTLTGPDANGYYTITLTGVTVPATATMVSGGIGYTYCARIGTDVRQQYAAVHGDRSARVPVRRERQRLAGKGGLIVPPPDVWKVATGFTGRRAIVDNTKCSTCHVTLGVGPDFHAGQRNDSSSCNWCHRPNLTSNAWAGNAKDFIHSVHGAEKRSGELHLAR